MLVKGEGWEDIGEELDDIFIGDADIWRYASARLTLQSVGCAPSVAVPAHLHDSAVAQLLCWNNTWLMGCHVSRHLSDECKAVQICYGVCSWLRD